MRRKTSRVRRIPKGHRVDVTRGEFDRIIDLLNERGEILNNIIRNQDIQFQRIAQIQAELDQIRRAWAKPSES